MAKIKKKREKTLEYKVFTLRISESNKKWLKKERLNFRSWNLLFNNLKQKHESVPKMSKQQMEI